MRSMRKGPLFQEFKKQQQRIQELEDMLKREFKKPEQTEEEAKEEEAKEEEGRAFTLKNLGISSQRLTELLGNASLKFKINPADDTLQTVTNFTTLK